MRPYSLYGEDLICTREVVVWFSERESLRAGRIEYLVDYPPEPMGPIVNRQVGVMEPLILRTEVIIPRERAYNPNERKRVNRLMNRQAADFIADKLDERYDHYSLKALPYRDLISKNF